MLVPFVNSYQVQITIYKSHHFSASLELPCSNTQGQMDKMDPLIRSIKYRNHTQLWLLVPSFSKPVLEFYFAYVQYQYWFALSLFTHSDCTVLYILVEETMWPAVFNYLWMTCTMFITFMKSNSCLHRHCLFKEMSILLNADFWPLLSDSSKKTKINITHLDCNI